MANEPKVGTATILNGMFHITWDDGSKMIVPDFTINTKYGWSVTDA